MATAARTKDSVPAIRLEASRPNALGPCGTREDRELVTSIVAPFGPWEPAQPSEAAAIFSTMPCPWWIAGGYAIELAVGQPVREHGDIDVLVLRPDQLHIQQALHGWQWWAADPPGTLRPWQPREQLPAGIHDIWCRPGPDQPWRIQVMIDESNDGDVWLY